MVRACSVYAFATEPCQPQRHMTLVRPLKSAMAADIPLVACRRDREADNAFCLWNKPGVAAINRCPPLDLRGATL